MITLPTRELIGALADVVPFAGTDGDDPTTNCVRLEWDGERLITLATDRFRVARLTWSPDDEADLVDDDDAALYGADDVPAFSVRIGLDDARSIIKAFRLRGAKRQAAPVTIAVTLLSMAENTYTVRMSREGSGTWSPLAFDVAGVGAPREFDPQPEIDLHTLIAKTTDVEAHLPGVKFAPKGLAAFGRVRSHGPLELVFTGPERAAVRFEMGTRFCGLIMPIVEQAPGRGYPAGETS